MNQTTSKSVSFFSVLKQTAADWMEDNALRLSAALAYYSIFSIAPLLVLCVGLAGLFFEAKAVQGHLDEQLSGLVGNGAAEAIQTMVQSTSQQQTSVVATVIGLVTLILGASGVFGQLKDALNTIWEVKAKPGLGIKGFIRERLLSFGMVLVIGFLLLVSFLLTIVLNAMNKWMEHVLELPAWIWGGAGLLVSFAVMVLLFMMIFKVLPDVEITWRQVAVGAVATGLLFEIGKFGLAYYLGMESTKSSFGAAGSVVLLLLWVYYASCILLFGAEFTKVYAEAHGTKLQPSVIAEPVTAEARAQQGIAARGRVDPRRESLALVFPDTPEPLPVAFPRSWQEVPAYVRDNMAVGMIGALGCGLAAGLVTRAIGHTPTRKPTEEIRLSSRVLGTAAVVLATRLGRGAMAEIRRAITKRVWPRFDRVTQKG